MKHEHEDFYNQRIKQNVGIIWVQIKYYLISLAALVIAELVFYWLGWWPIVALVGLFLVVVILVGVFWFCSPTLWIPLSMIVRLYRQKRIALQHPAIVTQTIWNAHTSVQNELANWSEKKLLTRTFRHMLHIYQELDRLSTPELERLREEAGLTNPYGHSFPFGKTLRESLISTIYAGRLKEEDAKLQATAEALIRSETYTKTEPSLQRRKERELEKEALEQELSKYMGSRTQSDPHELQALSGQYVIHSINGEKARIVFTLASGEYIAELYDYREKNQDAESFTVDQDGGTYVLKLNGRGFSEHTEITLINKESEAREEITLW